MAFELPTILMKLQIVSRNIHNVFVGYKRALLNLKSVYSTLSLCISRFQISAIKS